MFNSGSDRADFSISGRFDAFSAPKFEDAVLSVMNDGVFNIVIDLSDVVFIDSTALAELVKVMKRSRESGGDLELIDPSDSVKVIFEVTRLDQVFTIRQERQDEAVLK